MALAEYLTGLLSRIKADAAPIPQDLALLEPVEPAWNVGALGVGYDEARDRIVVEASELTEDEEGGEEPAAARCRISRAQAAGFGERAQGLMRGSGPRWRLCTQPMDPSGHVCPRQNGHIAHKS